MNISDITINCLHDIGIKRWAPVYVCSECDKSPHQMDKKAPHALQADYDEVKKDRAIKASEKKVLLTQISGIMHTTSRCCGADLYAFSADYYQSLYDMWHDRMKISNLPLLDNDLPLGKDKKGRVIMLESMRKRYGAYSKYVDDDFIIMHELWGMSDTQVGHLIRIFRQEDEIQKQTSEIPTHTSEATLQGEPKALIQPPSEMDFLEWVQNW